MIKDIIKLSIFTLGSFFIYGQPILQNYTSENSPLPFNTVRCIAIQGGKKWFGTDVGLASFDGNNWQVFTSNNSVLSNDNIRSLKVQNDSILWIGTMQGGLFKKSNDSWINYNESNSGLNDNLVRGIEIDSSNNIWLATSEGVSKFNGQSWQVWNVADNGLPTNNITDIRTGFSNEKYISTINGGLFYFDVQNNIEVHSIVESGLPDNSSIDIDIDSTGQPWFATPAAGLVTDLGNGGPWARWNITNSPIPTNGLTCISINKEDQRIFMGSELFGIIIKQNDVWQSYNQQNSDLPTNHITAIVHESSHVKWIGTFNNGVIRLEESSTNSKDIELPETIIYPNLLRAGEIITVKLKSNFNNVIITGNYGYKYISEIENNTIKLPNNLSNGLYVLQLKSQGTWHNIKFMVY